MTQRPGGRRGSSLALATGLLVTLACVQERPPAPDGVLVVS